MKVFFGIHKTKKCPTSDTSGTSLILILQGHARKLVVSLPQRHEVPRERELSRPSCSFIPSSIVGSSYSADKQESGPSMPTSSTSNKKSTFIGTKIFNSSNMAVQFRRKSPQKSSSSNTATSSCSYSTSSSSVDCHHHDDHYDAFVASIARPSDKDEGSHSNSDGSFPEKDHHHRRHHSHRCHHHHRRLLTVLLFLLGCCVLAFWFTSTFFQADGDGLVIATSSTTVGSDGIVSRRNSDVQDDAVRSEHVETLIRYFQESVAEKVEVQIGSWFRHQPGVPRAELLSLPTSMNGSHSSHNSAKDAEKWSSTGILSSWWSNGKKSSGSSSYAEGTSARTSNIAEDNNNTIVWDDENDVSAYFDRLLAGCSFPALSDGSRFDDKCFGFLLSLIQQPRCTVRLDSRTVCGNGIRSGGSNKQSQVSTFSASAGTVSIQSILGPDHFSRDTVNVVIIGTGPVGLYLANALMEMQRQPEYKADASRRKFTEIRLVMFENRVYENGHKKPYIRDWITAVGYFVGGFKGVIDQRIKELLDRLFKGPNTALPLNAWETLLLLSNRQQGVKFVYDDLGNFKHLLREVPNLLMFDATGHRLNSLNRGDFNGRPDNDGSDDERQVQTTVNERWEASTPEMEKVGRSSLLAHQFQRARRGGHPVESGGADISVGGIYGVSRPRKRQSVRHPHGKGAEPPVRRQLLERVPGYS